MGMIPDPTGGPPGRLSHYAVGEDGKETCTCISNPKS